MKLLPFVLTASAVAFAQTRSLNCNEKNSFHNRLVSACEMREQTIGYGGRLAVDGGMNGGVAVKGWDNSSILVRTKIETAGRDEGAAKSIASQIKVVASAGQVSATGPEMNRDNNWSVTYEIFVPRNANVNLKAHNGGISISDIRGNIQFNTTNGGVNLSMPEGYNAHFETVTVNGHLNTSFPVTVRGNISHKRLATDIGAGGPTIHVETTNGGVNLKKI